MPRRLTWNDETLRRARVRHHLFQHGAWEHQIERAGAGLEECRAPVNRRRFETSLRKSLFDKGAGFLFRLAMNLMLERRAGKGDE